MQDQQAHRQVSCPPEAVHYQIGCTTPEHKLSDKFVCCWLWETQLRRMLIVNATWPTSCYAAANHIWRPACTGQTPAKPIQVVLPDGQRRVWRVATTKDLDRLLNTNNARGGALIDKSTDPPKVFVGAEHLQANHLYHIHARGHSSPVRTTQRRPFRTNLTLWLPVDGGARYIQRILPMVTEAGFRHVLANYSADGVRAAEQPENLVLGNIAELEDNAEYYGVLTGTSALRGAVGAHSSTISACCIFSSGGGDQ